MKDTDKKPRGRGMLVMAAAAVAVVGTAGYFLTTTGNAPAPTPSATASEAATVGIDAGSGGRALGADGVTRIGYEPSCEGAVQAATNYLPAVAGFGNVPDEKQREIINQVFLPNSTDRLQQIQYVHDRRTEPLNIGPGEYIQTHPEWGGVYKIFSCEPGKKATIGVLVCRVQHAERLIEGRKVPDSYSCETPVTSLEWTGSGTAADWKVNGFNHKELRTALAGQLPETSLEVPQSKDGYPLSKDLLAKVMVTDDGTALEGWVDYANVSRK